MMNTLRCALRRASRTARKNAAPSINTAMRSACSSRQTLRPRSKIILEVHEIQRNIPSRQTLAGKLVHRVPWLNAKDRIWSQTGPYGAEAGDEPRLGRMGRPE